jgi:hypothetical protein
MMQGYKRLAQTIAVAVGTALILGLAVLFVTIHNLDRTFAKADLTPLVVTAKGALTEFVVVNGPSRRASRENGLIETKKDSTALQADAKLFDAWQSSLQIAGAALRGTTTGSWIHSSEEVPYLTAAQRRDPWNHTLCLLRRGDVVAVISGGPNAPSSPVCKDTKISENELGKLPRSRLLETPAGNLLLVIDGNTFRARAPTS